MKQNFKILIVEDSKTQAEELKYILESNYFKVECGNNAEEALALLKHYVPDIIISDILMPGMDGFELCSLIKSDDNLKNIPVILLTFLSDPADIIKGLECGADGFITKPYSEDFLLSKIEYLLMNFKLRKGQRSEMGLEVYFLGKKHLISSSRLQIVDLLFSTYESAVLKNEELKIANNELKIAQSMLNKLNKNLEKKVIERTKRIEEINTVLRVISEINQLIIKEKDRNNFIKEACSIIKKSGVFQNAWIALTDKNGNVTDFTEEGIIDNYQKSYKEMFQDSTPYCITETLETDDILIIDETTRECSGCPRQGLKDSMNGVEMFKRLKSGTKTYGVFMVKMPKHFVVDDEQRFLFKEIAEDIAFALYNIDLEEQRKLAEERHRQLLENLHAAVVVHDAKTNIKYSNSKASELLDLTTEQLFGKTAMDPNWYFFREDTSVMPYEEYPVNVVLSTQKPLINYVVGLNRPVKKDKIWVLVNAYPVYKDDKIDHVVVTFIEITDRIELEKQLLIKDIVFESGISANSIADNNGIITHVNEAFLKLWDYETREAAIGKSVDEFYVNQKDANIVLRELTTKGKWMGEFKAKTRKGKQFISKGFASVILDKSGVQIGYQSANIDVTKEIKARKKLEKTLKDLRQSNADLEQFAYVASHDLQEPLRNVKNFTELFARKYVGKIDEKADTYIDYITGGAERMQTLIFDLLSYSRITTRGGEFEETNLNEIVDDVLENLQLLIKENNAKIIVKDLPVIKVDGAQMAQLFQNLIGNAIKFKNNRTPEIEINAKKKNDEWIIFVKDNGIGIDMKYANKIFEVFQRLHTRDEYSGTGIGLAICKRIIERHNGKIWIESEIGNLSALSAGQAGGQAGGTTFYFTIPEKKGVQ